jgi:type IV pilus assembly protein PilQ
MLSLVSCTSQETSDDAMSLDDSGGAINDSDLADSGAPAATKSAGEDDLEAELDTSGEDKAAPAKKDAQDELAADEGLEKDLGQQDLQPQDQPPAEAPVQTEELQPAAPMAEQAPELTPDAAPPAPVAAAPEAEKARVRDIRYLSNSNGGTIVIETSKPVTYQSRMNPQTQQFVIEIADVELPPALQRPYNMKEFGSRFGSINAYQGAGSTTARVVIQLSGNSGEPIVQQEGTSLVVIPPTAAAPVAAAEAPAPKKESMEMQRAHEGSLAAKSLDEFLTGNQKFFGRGISLQVKDADVRDVVNFLAEESGANIVMSDDVGGKISLKLRKIPWDQALVTVMRSKALGYVRQGNVLRISTLKALQGETEATNKILEAQKAFVPAVVQVIPVSYAELGDLVKSTTPFLSKEGKVVADNRSSTLIVTDKVDTVDRIIKLVKTLDIAPAQVSIESKIVEAVEGFDNFVGVNWGISGSPVHLSPGGGAEGAPIDLTPSISSATLSKDFTGALPFQARMNIGTLDVFGDLSATLTLAEHDSLAKVISAPRISTMNKEKSTIVQQGENVSVITTRSETTGSTTKSEKRTPFSLELSVTPQITADGGVIMDLDVKREFLGPIVDAETGARAVNMRKAKTKVLVRNGQTAVIGGIYTSDELEATNGVPGLMNIPILGWLFKNRSFSRSKNELLIFMTPRILANETGPAEQAANP